MFISVYVDLSVICNLSSSTTLQFVVYTEIATRLNSPIKQAVLRGLYLRRINHYTNSILHFLNATTFCEFSVFHFADFLYWFFKPKFWCVLCSVQPCEGIQTGTRQFCTNRGSVDSSAPTDPQCAPSGHRCTHCDYSCVQLCDYMWTVRYLCENRCTQYRMGRQCTNQLMQVCTRMLLLPRAWGVYYVHTWS